MEPFEVTVRVQNIEPDRFGQKYAYPGQVRLSVGIGYEPVASLIVPEAVLPDVIRICLSMALSVQEARVPITEDEEEDQTEVVG